MATLQAERIGDVEEGENLAPPGEVDELGLTPDERAQFDGMKDADRGVPDSEEAEEVSEELAPSTPPSPGVEAPAPAEAKKAPEPEEDDEPRSWLLPLPEIGRSRNAFLLPWLLFFSLHFQLRLGFRLFLFVLIVKPSGPQTEMIKQPVDDLHLVDRGRLPPQTLQPLHHRNVVDRLLARFNQPTGAALPERPQNISLGHETPLFCLNPVS